MTPYRENADPAAEEPAPERVTLMSICHRQIESGYRYATGKSWLVTLSRGVFDELMNDVSAMTRFMCTTGNPYAVCGDEILFRGPMGPIRVRPQAGQVEPIRMYVEV